MSCHSVLAKNSGALLTRAKGGLPLLLVALLKGNGALMVSAHVVQILDFVDADNPVLAGECLFEDVELWTLCGQRRTADSVLRLTRGKELIKVVIGHFVPRKAAG